MTQSEANNKVYIQKLVPTLIMEKVCVPSFTQLAGGCPGDRGRLLSTSDGASEQRQRHGLVFLGVTSISILSRDPSLNFGGETDLVFEKKDR